MDAELAKNTVAKKVSIIENETTEFSSSLAKSDYLFSSIGNGSVDEFRLQPTSPTELSYDYVSAIPTSEKAENRSVSIRLQRSRFGHEYSTSKANAESDRQLFGQDHRASNPPTPHSLRAEPDLPLQQPVHMSQTHCGQDIEGEDATMARGGPGSSFSRYSLQAASAIYPPSGLGRVSTTSR